MVFINCLGHAAELAGDLPTGHIPTSKVISDLLLRVEHVEGAPPVATAPSTMRRLALPLCSNGSHFFRGTKRRNDAQDMRCQLGETGRRLV